MDPHSVIHQGQVYSILVHVPYLYFLLPTAASFPHLSSSTSSCCPPPPPPPSPLTCPSLLASVPARLAFRTFPPLFLFFPPPLPPFIPPSLLHPLAAAQIPHLSRWLLRSPNLTLLPPTLLQKPQQKKQKKTPTAPKEDRYSCSLLKLVFCPPPPNPFPSVDSSKWVVSASFLFLFPSLSSHFLWLYFCLFLIFLLHFSFTLLSPSISLFLSLCLFLTVSLVNKCLN